MMLASAPLALAAAHGLERQGVELAAVVCTRERPEALRRALTSLLDQHEPLDEILVVDNAAASDRTRRLVEHHFHEVRYVLEPTLGVGAARQRALTSTTCEIIAFLDDDAVAAPDWAGAFRSAFRGVPDLAACTGRVLALAEETEAQRLFQANGGFDRGVERIRLPADRARPLHGLPAPLIAWAVSAGSGCSLAVRRSAALAVGGVDVLFGADPVLPGGEDLDLLWRLLTAGYAVQYEPSVLAWHEHRRDIRALSLQLSAHQRSLVAVLVKASRTARGLERLAFLAFIAWRLLKPGVRLIRWSLGRDPLPAAILLQMWIDCWAGLGAYRAARARCSSQAAG